MSMWSGVGGLGVGGRGVSGRGRGVRLPENTDNLT